jgi:F-type H+-transporting ATPase subunit delta
MGSVARRYANALIKLSANDQAKANANLETFKVLSELFTNAESRRILLSPVMPVELKRNLLTYGLEQGAAKQELTALIDIIVEAGRVSEIPKVAEAYQKYLDEMQGMVKAEVVTAVALSADEKADVAKELSALVKKKVDVESTVDVNILGGFVAKIGNYRIDLSLKSKLEGLSQNAVQDTLG